MEDITIKHIQKPYYLGIYAVAAGKVFCNNEKFVICVDTGNKGIRFYRLNSSQRLELPMTDKETRIFINGMCQLNNQPQFKKIVAWARRMITLENKKFIKKIKNI